MSGSAGLPAAGTSTKKVTVTTAGDAPTIGTPASLMILSTLMLSTAVSTESSWN